MASHRSVYDSFSACTPQSFALPSLKPEADAPTCGHFDYGEALAVAVLLMDANPLRAEVLGGRAAAQKLGRQVDLLGEFGGELPPGLGARAHPERYDDGGRLDAGAVVPRHGIHQ